MGLSSGRSAESLGIIDLTREVEENVSSSWVQLGVDVGKGLAQAEVPWLKGTTRSKRKRIEEVGQNKKEDIPLGLQRVKCQCKQPDHWKSIVEYGEVSWGTYAQKLKLLDHIVEKEAKLEQFVCIWHKTKIAKYLGLTVDGVKVTDITQRLLKLKEIGMHGIA